LRHTTPTMKTRLLFLLLFFSGICYAQEICDNGIDDDGDGFTDLNDSDCKCGNQTPVPSIIPNASFENYNVCPSGPSQLNYCTGWVQATTATTDYYNTCGMITEAVRALSGTLMPFPDGDGISGAIFKPDWNEYLGSCLISPMLKDTTYQITCNIASVPITDYGETCNNNIIDYDPVSITIYGTQNCVFLPLQTVISPDRASEEWVELGKAIYIPQLRWGQFTITFTPATDIAAIMIGAPPTLPPSYAASSCHPYFLFDNLTLNQTSNFDVNINATGDYCNGDLTLTADLSVTVSNDAAYQWYNEGVAISGATQNSFTIPPGSGNLAQYTVRVADGAECFLSPTYTTNTFSPSPNITIVEPNCIHDGTITVTTLADFYSFDNGITWQASNESGPLQPGIYSVKTKTATGCTSLASIANLSFFSNLTYINYTSVNPVCGTNGNITITSVGSQYSFDGGATWQTDNTKDLPYGYHNIKIKDATGCVTGENHVYLQQPYLNQPVVSSVNANCASGGTITVNTPADLYSLDNGTTWSASNIFSSLATGYYYVKIKDATGCESERMFVYIGVDNVTAPVAEESITYCQYSAATPLTATGTDILWYDTASGGVPVTIAPTPDTTIIGEVWYYASQTIRGCEGPRVAIKVTTLEKPGLATATQFYDYCQDFPAIRLSANGTGLRWYTTGTGGNGNDTAPLPSTRVAGTFYYYVCQSLNGCEGDRITIEVLIYPTPPEPVTETQLYYEQYDPTLPLTARGENITWYNNLYMSLTESPVVSSQELGNTVYYVSQTINGCTSPLQKITVTILPNYITIKYPKYFTPNGDQLHETWNVYTPDFGIRATTYIFDRYGKLVKQVFSPGTGWDGTLNGSPMPSSDYWFATYYTEYDVNKVYKSHFSLVR
jgi:gliding motility-associated-like protein